MDGDNDLEALVLVELPPLRLGPDPATHTILNSLIKLTVGKEPARRGKNVATCFPHKKETQLVQVVEGEGVAVRLGPTHPAVAVAWLGRIFLLLWKDRGAAAAMCRICTD